MAPLLIILAVLGGAGFFYWLSKQPRKVKIRWLIYLAAGALIALVATNRLHWLGAVFATLLVIGKKLFLWMRFLPLLGNLFAQYQAYTKTRQGHAGRARTQDAMSREEALAVLELKPGATREEVIAAHKRLMQKLHPDRGGSTHLAQKINQAKEVLLKGT